MHQQPILATLTLCLASLTTNAQAQAAEAAPSTSTPARELRYVVFHRPGAAWQPAQSMFEQPHNREHVQHYRQLLDAGKLALGGPHLDEKGGGMMITTSGATGTEIKRFAAEDPAVRNGGITFKVRPWIVGMSQGGR